MHRVLAALRLLTPKRQDVGPLRISADSGLSAASIGEFLDACFVAVAKIRAFGLRDEQFGGKIHLADRAPAEIANGRYMKGSDRVFVFHPQVRGVPDILWTIVHELGHRVWYRVLTEAERELWRGVTDEIGKPISPSAANALTRMAIRRPSIYPMWFYYQRHFGANPTGFQTWLQTRRFGSSEFPTDYSNASPGEAWADTFADTVLGRAHRGMPLRRSGPFLKKLFISIADRIRDPRPIAEDCLLEEQDHDFLQSQVELPAVQAKLDAWLAKHLSEDDILAKPGPAHVTVVYGLDKRDLPQIQEVAEAFGRPVRIVLGRLNYFDAPQHDVLYIEAVSAGLFALHNELVKLPHTRPQTHSAYVPHLTVAYLKKGVAKKFVETSPIQAIVAANRLSLIDASNDVTAIPLVQESSPSYSALSEGGRGAER